MTYREKVIGVKKICSDERHQRCDLEGCAVYKACHLIGIPYAQEIYDKPIKHGLKVVDNCCTNRIIAVCDALKIDIDKYKKYSEDDTDYVFDSCEEIYDFLFTVTSEKMSCLPKRQTLDLTWQKIKNLL